MSRAYSSFIPASQVEAQTVEGWEFGSVDSVSSRFAAKLKERAAAEEEQRQNAQRQSGYNEGYSAGYAQGHAAATLEGQRQISDYIATEGQQAAERFLSLFAQAQDQQAALEQKLAQGALELACTMARSILRQELAANPNALLPVLREAVGTLSVETRAAVVRLHPQDLEVFAPVLQAEFPRLALTLVPDATLSRGGCLVEAAGAVVDGTVERRWQKAVASLGLDTPWEPAE